MRVEANGAEVMPPIEAADDGRGSEYVLEVLRALVVLLNAHGHKWTVEEVEMLGRAVRRLGG